MMKLEMTVGERGRLVLAAVSGGPDSVAMLALLREAALEGELRLCAAHFEHGIRGEASREDARFVRQLCEEWEILLLEGAADVPALAASRGIGLEQAARDARYGFLRRAKAETGAQVIALAHHLDDQAETVLMHLLRGSGLRGAAGMAVREGDLWRPLLNCRKAEIVQYLREKGIPWREDASNALPDNPRNIIRLEAMPALERAYPGAVRALGRFAQIARAEDAFMAGETDAFLRAHAEIVPVGWRLDCVDAPPAIVRRALRTLTGLDAAGCLAAEALYRAPGGRAAFPGVMVERTGGSLYLVSRSVERGETPLPAKGVAALPGVGEIACAPAEPVPRGDPFDQVLDADSLAGACVRTRRPGDFIRPLGLLGTQKLSDYFINRRVDRPMRDAVLLVAKGSEVLWAAGIGVSETARLRTGSEGLRLTAREYRRRWAEHGDS